MNGILLLLEGAINAILIEKNDGRRILPYKTFTPLCIF